MQVRDDRSYAFDVGRRPSRQSVNLPTPLNKMISKTVTNNAAGSDHKC